jgi:hypothetical protein
VGFDGCVLGGFSVSGACPPALYPTSKAAPVVAYHGANDDVSQR